MRTPKSLETIKDPKKRLRAASAAVREAESVADTHRAIRDHAAMVMLEPFVRARIRGNAMAVQAARDYHGYYTIDGHILSHRSKATTRARLARDLDAPVERHEGTLTTAEYEARLAEIRDVVREDMDKYEVTERPEDVRQAIGVSRNMLHRIMDRVLEAVQAGGVEPWDDDREPRSAAIAEARATAKADARRDALMATRQRVLMALLTGTDPVTGDRVDPVSGMPIVVLSNAEVARLVGLSTARVSQMRTGRGQVAA